MDEVAADEDIVGVVPDLLDPPEQPSGTTIVIPERPSSWNRRVFPPAEGARVRIATTIWSATSTMLENPTAP